MGVPLKNHRRIGRKAMTKWVGQIMAIDLVILVLWTAVDPSQPSLDTHQQAFDLEEGTLTTTYRVQDTACEYGTTAGVLFEALALLYKAVLLGGGRGQAQTRRCKVGPRRLATSQGMNKSD